MNVKHTPATPLRTGADVQAHPMEALNEITRLRAVNAKLVEALQDSICDLQLAERHYPESAKTVLERRRALLRELGEDA